MIDIKDKHLCCGCSACVQSCPKQCIAFYEDKEGFQYPVVDASVCIDCKLCEKVCPYLNQDQVEKRNPLRLEMTYNPDTQVRLNSSSGGLFTMFSKYVINKGGVVFGARFNENWEVIHDCTESCDNLNAFRGSKYVQSRIGCSYQTAMKYLDDGRFVLFSGTPCQIFGLKKFLRKDYDNLFTLDFVCHGVPSPKVWRDYLNYINPGKEQIVDINMKDKSRSWSRYSYKVESNQRLLYDDYAANSEYLQLYINGFSVRPSCFNCPVKGGRSQSDITLADAWGINRAYPDLNDEKGASVICINSEAGNKIYDAIAQDSRPFPMEVFFEENPSFRSSASEPRLRDSFWNLYESEGINAYFAIKRKNRLPLHKRLLNRFIRLLKTGRSNENRNT